MKRTAFEKYDEYKDGVTDWLRAVPAHWEVRRLKDLAQVKTGSKDTVNSVEDGMYPFFVRSQTVERIDSYSYDGEAVLTAGDGVGVGKVFHYVNGKFDYHQRVYKISHFRGVDGRFLFYYMKANFYKDAMRLNAKSTVDSLRLPMFRDFFVVLGRLEEQEAIAEYLDCETNKIDRRIDLLTQKAELYGKLKQSLVKETVTGGLDRTVARKDSDIEWLGEIPVHWAIDRAKSMFKKMSRPVSDSDGIVTAFRDGQVTLRRNRRTIGFTQALKEHGYQGIRVGDLIVHAMDAFAGAIGVSDSDGKSSPVYTAYTPIDSSRVYIPYYGLLLRQMALSGFVSSLGKGIRERSSEFRHKEIAPLRLPVPPYEEQVAIANYLDSRTTHIDRIVNTIQAEIDKLSEFRNTLINDVVTGKIKVT